MSGTIVTHIEPGETLSEIAVRYGVSVDALQRWNRIDNPDLVLAGQRIVVYRAGSPESSPSERPGSLEEPGLDAVSDSFDVWIVGAIVLALLLFALRRKRRVTPPISRTPSLHEPQSRIVTDQHDTIPHRADTLAGKAYVTDGDGIRVSGREIRFAGLDAPEFDQVAKHRDGYWFGHGKRVKSALIREVGGRQVHVAIEDHDKFGRAVGIVTCNGKDIGEWLVREGHAIAAYGDRYKQVEREARKAKRGMWGHAVNIDPRRWRHRNSARR